jgi:hypothetical protein
MPLIIASFFGLYFFIYQAISKIKKSGGLEKGLGGLK